MVSTETFRFISPTRTVRPSPTTVHDLDLVFSIAWCFCWRSLMYLCVSMLWWRVRRLSPSANPILSCSGLMCLCWRSLSCSCERYLVFVSMVIQWMILRLMCLCLSGEALWQDPAQASASVRRANVSQAQACEVFSVHTPHKCHVPLLIDVLMACQAAITVG